MSVFFSFHRFSSLPFSCLFFSFLSPLFFFPLLFILGFLLSLSPSGETPKEKKRKKKKKKKKNWVACLKRHGLKKFIYKRTKMSRKLLSSSPPLSLFPPFLFSFLFFPPFFFSLSPFLQLHRNIIFPDSVRRKRRRKRRNRRRIVFLFSRIIIIFIGASIRGVISHSLLSLE